MKAILYLLAAILLAPAISDARQKVIVGLAPFPPFIDLDEEMNITGIAPEMMTAMNSFQDDYEFVGKLTSARRRHLEFREGLFDLSFFDHLRWGWDGLPVAATDVYFSGGEKYIALAAGGRGQDFFTDFHLKTMVGVTGYHYGFAGFNSDGIYLRQQFNMQLPTEPASVIKMILHKRGEIGVVTEAFLNRYFVENPQDRPHLLVSDRYDQKYDFSLIVRLGINPTVDDLNRLLRAMRKAGAFDPIWRKYGYVPSG